ncbi:MAG: TonB family protein [Bacteroidia bacterium]|nr:TonB family protein [Bacteroidia bacterium]
MSFFISGMNLDEITFEKRNKDYGAYFLRRIYKKHMTVAMTIALTILILVVGPVFINAKLNTNRKQIIDNSVVADLENVNKQQEDEAPPPPPPPPPPPALEQQVKFTAPVVVDTVEEKVDLAVTEEVVQNTQNEQVQEEVVEVKEEKKEVQQEEMQVFTVVEEPPTFPGGEEALLKYIGSNIKYPEIAKENNITGKVYIQFVIEPNGKVSNVKVVRGVDPALDKEASRVIESLPQWTPGKQAGRAVRVAFTVPINFKLN